MLPIPQQSLLKHHLPLASWELVTFFLSPLGSSDGENCSTMLEFVTLVCFVQLKQTDHVVFRVFTNIYVGDVYSSISFRLPVVFLEIVCFF